MNEDDLELLITLDDPGEDAQEEDTSNHLQADNTAAFGHPPEVVIENDPYRVAFGQGDWTCTLMRFSGTTNDAVKGNMTQVTNKNFEIECCTVTQWKNGQIVEEKVFYELVGLRKQISDDAKNQ